MSCQIGEACSDVEKNFGNNFAFLPCPANLNFLLIFFTIPVIYYIVYRLIKWACRNVWDHFTVSAQVDSGISRSDEELATQLLKWLADNVPKENVPWFTVFTKILHHEISSVRRGNRTVRSFVKTCPPSYGIHYFEYNGAWIRLERTINPKIKMRGSTCERITLTTWRGIGKRELLEGILEEAVKQPPEQIEEEKVYVFSVHRCGQGWDQSGDPKRRRLISSVILSEGSVERVLGDMNGFIDRQAWYLEREIPHRRGYLFFGPPGCGKTSFVKAIAGEIGFSICILSLSAQGLTDESLTILMDRAPQNSIILLEDIDAAFKSREDSTATSKETNLAFEGRGRSALTFRGLLNALDGVATSEGRIICMTANYVDKLDPALIRPGRIDQKVFIDYPSRSQLTRLFKRFYPESTDEMREEFADSIESLQRNVSVAAIQGLFMLHKDSANDALIGLNEYFGEQISLGQK